MVIADPPSTDKDSFIPFARPDVGQPEIEAVAGALSSGWVTSGPVMKTFEAEFGNYLGGAVEAVAVNSATAGLHLALEALGVGPGDEVIVPTWTFTATAAVVRHVGATPLIVDVEPSNLTLDLERLDAHISDRTRAVIPVHLAGCAVDLIRLRQLVGTDIRIIEDAAHALPAVGTAGLVGDCSVSDAAVFSFYATKTITTGEGGMLTTRLPEVADRAQVMRLHGMDRDALDRYVSTRSSWAYDVVAPGFKYNMPDPAAAIGRVQLMRVDEMHRRRSDIAEYYLRELAGLPLVLPAEVPASHVHSWHLFIVRLSARAQVSRDEFINAMRARGVGTSVHYIPLHHHTYWKDFVSDPDGILPVAEQSAPVAATLPLYSKMTDSDVERVVDAAQSILR